MQGMGSTMLGRVKSPEPLNRLTISSWDSIIMILGSILMLNSTDSNRIKLLSKQLKNLTFRNSSKKVRFLNNV